MKKRHMLQKYLKDTTKRDVTSFYNCELRKNEGIYYFSMVGHYTWDFWLGEGKTIEEAVKKVKVATNCYNHDEFPPLRDKLNGYEEVDFSYKPEEIVEMKSVSILGGTPVESSYTFVDEKDAYNFFGNHRSAGGYHNKILQRINEEWVDVTNKFKS